MRMSERSESNTRWRARLLALAALLLVVSAGVFVRGESAAEASCPGDDWADYGSWLDNYWVSDSCLTQGEYVRDIQKIINDAGHWNDCSAGVIDG